MTFSIQNTHRCSGDRCSRSGFTLLEMLMAVTITTVITIALYAIFDQTQRAFRAGIAQVDVYESARATSEIFDQDIVRVTHNPLERQINRIELPPNIQFNSYPFNIWLDDRAPYTTLGNMMNQQGMLTAQQNLLMFTRLNDEVTLVGYYNEPLAVNWSNGQRPASIPLVSRLYRFTQTYKISDLTEPVLSLALEKFRRGPSGSLNDPSRPFQEVTTGVVHLRWNLFGSNGQWWQFTTDPLLLKSSSGRSPFVGMTAGGNIIPASIEYELMVLEEEVLQQFLNMAEANTQQAADFIRQKLEGMHFIRKRVSTSHFQ